MELQKGLSLKELGLVCFPDGKKESDLLVLLKTYIDDSTDGNRERVAVAGAFMGRFGQWSSLQETWRKRLRREGIEYFHSTDYYGLSGQFFRYRDPERYPKPAGSQAAKQLRDDLESIIRRNRIAGFAVCVPIPLFREFKSRDAVASGIFTEPFEFALQCLFKQLADEVKSQIGEGHRLTFVVDESDRAARIMRVYHEFKRINPGLAASMGALTHLDDKVCPPLQAADMMASIAKEIYTEWPGGDEKSIPRHLSDRVGAIWVPDAAYFEAVLSHERVRRSADLPKDE